MTTDTRFAYWAFISYSHKDKAWGSWLHRALETYRIPRHLAGSEGRDGPVPSRIAPVFRDREELPTADDLGSVITEALSASRTLIVICSPHSASSRWVNEEILAFKRMGRANRILALIVDGEPNASDAPASEQRECFPRALRFKLGPDGGPSVERVEPIAADARPSGDGKRDACLKLIAGVLGIAFDRLKQREMLRRQRRWAIAAAICLAATVAASALTVWALLSKAEAEAQRAIADEQRDRARAAEWEARVEAARSMYDRSLPLIAEGRVQSAAAFLLRSLELAPRNLRPPGTPTWAEASWEMYRFIADSLELARPRFRMRGHADKVIAAAVSPDGTRAVTGSADETIVLWDLTTGTMVKRLERIPESSWYMSAAFSPDGRTIFGGMADGTFRSWTADLSRQLSSEEAHGIGVLALALSADGRRAATGSPNGNLVLWDLTGPRQFRQFEHLGFIRGVALNSDGTEVVCAAGDGPVRRWNVDSGEELKALVGHDGTVTALAIDGAGNRVLTGGRDGALRLWDLATAECLRSLPQDAGSIRGATFHPDGRHAWTAYNEGDVALWDLETGLELRRLESHEYTTYRIGPSPDGSKLLTGSFDGTAAVWELAPDLRLWRSDKYGFVGAESLPTLYAGIVTFWRSDIMEFWDSRDGRLFFTWEGDPADLTWPVTTDGAIAIRRRSDGAFEQFDLRGGGVERTLTGLPDSYRVGAIEPGGRRLLLASFEKAALAWDVATARGEEHPELVGDWRFLIGGTEDGREIAVANRDFTVGLWNWEIGGTRVLLKGHAAVVRSAILSADGKWVATGSEDLTVRVWDRTSGEQLRKIETGTVEANPTAFSEGGRYLLTLSVDGFLRLWDVESGVEIQSLRLQQPALVHAEFSGDGRELRAHGKDGRRWARSLVRTPLSERAPEVHPNDPDPYREFEPHYRRVGLRIVREGPARGQIAEIE